MNISVVIATVNRQDHLERLLACLDNQTMRPQEVIVSAPAESDLCDGIERYAGWVNTTLGKRGLTAQRNAALDLASRDAELVLFFDDDMTLRSDYIENCAASFAQHPNVVGLTGELLANGARSGTPVTFSEADAAIEASADLATADLVPVSSLYGCNFAVRASALRGLRFDERLPLYSWLEDLDFSRRLSANGLLIRDFSCLGVHHGSASGGRSQHVRYGYSQMTNAIYLWRKGSIEAKKALSLTVRPFIANAVGSIRGHEKESRRARLSGNFLSFADVIRGRLTPERIVSM